MGQGAGGPVTVDALLWAGVVVLTLGAGWLSLPRPPELDWERFFKTALVTLLRGPLEAEGASAAAWLTASRVRVWFHPGARDLVAKLTAPAEHEVPVPALSGELALVEALRGLPDEHARLRRTFLEEPLADETLFDDPVDLGEAYDTVPVLGPGADWEAVSRWEPAVVAGLRRRLAHTRIGVVGDPDLAAALVAELGPERVAALPEGPAEALLEGAGQLLPEPSDRVVWIGAGPGAVALARLLHAHAGLRDRTRAVVGLGAARAGDDGAWLAEHFHHEGMDTEIARTTPWFQLAFVVPGTKPLGEPGRPLADAAWPPVAEPENGRVAVEIVDLGVLPGPGADLDRVVLGRALLLTLVQRLALVG